MRQSLRRQDAVCEVNRERSPCRRERYVICCQPLAGVRPEIIRCANHRYDIVGVDTPALCGEISPVEFLHRPNGRVFVNPAGVAAAFEPDPGWQRRTLPYGVGAIDRKPKAVCDFVVVDPGEKYCVIVCDGDGFVHSNLPEMWSHLERAKTR